MTLLRWNLLTLILAIVAGVLSFSSPDPEVARMAKPLFFLFLLLVLFGLLIQALRSPGHHR